MSGFRRCGEGDRARPAVEGGEVLEGGLPRLVYNENEAAKMLGISKSTLQNLRKSGKLTAVRIGVRVVYEAGELREFLRRNRTA